VLTQADRAAEKRRVKLEEIQRQVKDGSLKIRKMTAQERKRFPPQAAKASRAKAPRR
jgi:predicted  nucleic acid-binding Zn-ribbon protein